jgi:hypothetical protein
MINLQKALDALRDAGVEFVLIGGAAMVAHGSAQGTQDIDICYDRSRENIRRLVRALEPYHPRLRGAPADVPFLFDERTIEHGLNFTLTTDLGDLDLLGEVTGLGPYTAVRAASETMLVYGKNCNILSLEGLIKTKRATGRPRDLLALPELEALRELRRELGRSKPDIGHDSDTDQ